MNNLSKVLLYLALSPLAGGLIYGLDRKFTARLQGRVGPPIWQPYLDVLKLFHKETLVVRKSQNIYIMFYLIFMIFSAVLFFAGENLLLVIFALTIAGVFFVLGAFKASSPYSFTGAQREVIQMMSSEPALFLSAIGMYMITGSFYISRIASFGEPLALYLPGLLFSFIYILPIKFRKSPFDLSTSSHAHQELVKGLTTDFSGRALAMIEIGHWLEIILMLGFSWLFFAANIFLGAGVSLLIYFFTVLVDNTFARLKWQMTLGSCWLVTFILGAGNIVVLHLIKR
ncbi:MAG: NADH-quinone oxidoreductase subunit H [Candidatus Omnitrophota bacterium]|nr:NADH-quinone oxidoreductase subunit H [Candidatus Omnitrophota bacterium]